MERTIFCLLLASFLPTVQPHYLWYSIILKGIVTPPFEYVRNVSYTALPETGSRSIVDPVFLRDPVHDYACNRGAFANAENTSIATLDAGEEFGIQAATGARARLDPIAPYHEGPVAVYLSRAPTGNVREYDGLGEWFKIGELGLDMSVPLNQKQHWLARDNEHIRFTVPETTPPGEYLLRMEQIYPWPDRNDTQIFVNCAQVEIVGQGGGTPAPLVHLEDFLDLHNPALSGWCTPDS
ncbi:lytic polysaccharide monooxygenase [Lophiostoma macrostomum CBS 122681]|uniref:lytic cellulose monooxygenase (C4-dehydrogenating) n=1 Tax=Lophiostoma macrostomum CBS 122681 TaxID=1314788 RepID=A0A6A6TQQ6_9PLEO|nr:lytic polysaccharide monooxygenase [Lophiostoma macrostomum CBS 122681]